MSAQLLAHLERRLLIRGITWAHIGNVSVSGSAACTQQQQNSVLLSGMGVEAVL